MYIVSAYYLALILAHAFAFFLLSPGVLFTIAGSTKVQTALYHALLFGLIALVAHTLMFRAFFTKRRCSCKCKCNECAKNKDVTDSDTESDDGTETLCVRTPYMFRPRG